MVEFLKANKLISKSTSPSVLQKILMFVKEKQENITEERGEEILKEIKHFCSNLLVRYNKCYQNYNKFVTKYSSWLKSKLFSCLEDNPQERSIGRPVKSFATCNYKTQKKRVVNLVETQTAEELALAAEISFRSAGKRNVANLINKVVTTDSPEILKKAKNIFNATTSNKEAVLRTYSPDEALALMIDTKMTKHQYNLMQKGAQERNSNLYPPYYLILKSKSECYPLNLRISEDIAEVKVQDLLNHTSHRLVKLQDKVLIQALTLISENHENIFFQLDCKWGLDGSGGHSLYKQKYNNDSICNSDSDILLTSLVPLQLHLTNIEGKKIVLWQNPRTSSTKFCRPLRFAFTRETTEMVQLEVERVEKEIASLIPTKVLLSSGQEVFVRYSLFKTMIDGKICNNLMKNSSSQACYICGACPKDMNNIIQVQKRPVNTNAFELGLSTLHAHIRFFECIIHLSYRLDIKKWQMRGSKEEKAAFELRKKTIINKFKSELGLLIDVVKQGYGSTNDGNTARRFFDNYKKSSEITGVDQDLIYKFSILLQALSCGFDININSFRNYALETAKYFVHLYPWFYLPASVHKILIHGADIIESLPLPIGQLSEDVQEARHKEFRFYREHNTRKISRVKTNEDLFHMFLISSDPVISSIRKLPSKNASAFSCELLALLRNPDIPN